MPFIKSFKELEEKVKIKQTPTMSVAYPHDKDTIAAIHHAVKENIVNAIMVGDQEVITEQCKKLDIPVGDFKIVHEPNEKKSGLTAVQLIVDKKADVLMKGTISTPYFLKAILNKEFGLIPKGALLSHTALIDVPTYDKMMLVSDVAMIPDPSLEDKVQMINYNIKIANNLGLANPKVALITANEKVSAKMPCTIDGAIISKMADRGQIKGGIIDGPLALDVALSPEACEIKGLKSPIEGQADILIFPNIETGNVFFKSVTLLAKGVLAGIVTGAPFPVVLVSRADSEESKYYSIVLSAALA